MRISIIKTTVLFCFIAALSLFADSLEEYDKKISHNAERIDEINRQIDVLNKEIMEAEAKQQDLSRQLNNSSRQISLMQEKIRHQQKELTLRRQKRNRLQHDFGTAMGRKDILIRQYRKRVIRAYKLKDRGTAQLILDAVSPRQAYYRIKYLSAVNEADKKLYHKIVNTMETIDVRREQLIREEKNISETVGSLREQKEDLEVMQNKNERQLKTLTSDKQALAEQIREKEKSRKKIRKIIKKTQAEKASYLKRLQEERHKREIIEMPFAERKGKLIWPAEGKVTVFFGTHRHPVLNTVTDNSGIDIQTDKDTQVFAVSDGMIVMITWLRGYGNTIIILHDKDYYTVYSHVENIQVTNNEYVDAGQHIAYVSSGGSMEGSKLHFELWKQQDKMNPLEWLKK